MKIKFWGTRGSLPSPGNDTVEYGGNTTCLEVMADCGDEYIFDAGTGIRELGADLMRRHNGNGKPLEARLFLTHKHWDHIQGFPFFTPAYVPGNKIYVYSGDAELRKGALTDRITKETRMITNKNSETNKAKQAFQHQQQGPYFPVSIDKMAADLSFKDLAEGEKVINGVEISYKRMSHPDGVFCYKVAENNHAIVFATDYEHDNNAGYITAGYDKRLIEWARGADVLIYDGQYTPELYEQRKGWGHSTYEKGIDIALEAGVKKVIFTHHDPASTDEMIHELEQKAREYAYKRTEGRYALAIEFAKEGKEYVIGDGKKCS